MSTICENCSDEMKYHSSNIDSFSNKKFDIFFCSRCFIGKTNLDKNFDFTPHYPENYYGKDGKMYEDSNCPDEQEGLRRRTVAVSKNQNNDAFGAPPPTEPDSAEAHLGIGQGLFLARRIVEFHHGSPFSSITL